MPLHSIELLPSGAYLGLWQLREIPAELWELLPFPSSYQPLLPVTTDTTRQAQWLAGRVLMHQLLAKFAPGSDSGILNPIWLTNDADGKPHLSGWPEAAVSLSHSGQWVAALLAPAGRAGVDVELVRDKARRLARRFLSDAELAAAEQPDSDPTVFSLLWSVKETVYKLAGQRGLIFREDILTELFSAESPGEVTATLRRAHGQTRHRVCYIQPEPGYVLTFCHEPTEFSLTSFST